MDAVNDPTVETVVAMVASQLGKTEALNNVLGFYVDHDPAPVLVIQPSIEMAEAWSKDRLAPMLRDTPALRGKVKDPRSRDSGNTILHKQFPGGQLTAVGANAPSGLASRPIRIVLADEVDRYPASAGTEGDPLTLAIQRTANFWNRKILVISTPTIKGESRIEAAYLEGDRRQYWVPCPHCEAEQILKWSGVHWPKEPEPRPLEAVYRCEACGVEITDAHKQTMLERGEWRAENPGGRTASFWISALYSPFVSFGKLADEWMKAQGNPERLKAFVNLKLAETWAVKIDGETLEEQVILDRAAESEYTYGEVPAGVRVLVAAIDTQNDRLEVSVIGYGEGEESWRIDREVILGDPNTPENQEAADRDPEKRNAWQRLDALLARSYPCVDGATMAIRAAVVDTGGGRTQAAYTYAASPRPIPVYAIKGSSQRGDPYVPIDKTGRAKVTIVKARSGRRLKLYIVGVHQGKDLLFALLQQEAPGPGHMHYPSDLDPEYAKQLTAEVRSPRKAMGQEYHVWEKKSGRRNEAIDLEVYARFLVRLLRVRLDAPPAPKAPDTGGTPSEPTATAAAEPKKKSRFRTVGGTRLT